MNENEEKEYKIMRKLNIIQHLLVCMRFVRQPYLTQLLVPIHSGGKN